jgi:WD40 repeat protein
VKGERQLCKFFLNGDGCRDGDRCNFDHSIQRETNFIVDEQNRSAVTVLCSVSFNDGSYFLAAAAGSTIQVYETQGWNVFCTLPIPLDTFVSSMTSFAHYLLVCYYGPVVTQSEAVVYDANVHVASVVLYDLSIPDLPQALPLLEEFYDQQGNDGNNIGQSVVDPYGGHLLGIQAVGGIPYTNAQVVKKSIMFPIQMNAQNDAVESMAVLCASLDFTISVWQVDMSNNSRQRNQEPVSSTFLQALRGHLRGVTGMDMDEQQNIVSCSLDQTIRGWNTESGDVSFTVVHEKPLQTIKVVDLSNNGLGPCLCVGDDSGSLLVYNYSDLPPSPLFILDLPAPCVCLTPSVMSVPTENNGAEPQQVVVAGGSDGSFSVIASIVGNGEVEFSVLYVLDFHTWQHNGSVTGLLSDYDGYMVSTSEDGELAVLTFN